MSKKKPDTFAAIDVGSNSFRMMIVNVTKEGKIQVFEDLKKSTTIGRDTFSFGRISFDSVNDACESLKGFSMLIKDYKIKHYRVVATSAIREAKNRQYVLEQIKSATGMDLEVINNAQERFLMNKAVKAHLEKNFDAGGTLILHIGSGGVEISVFSNGVLEYADYIKVGALRLKEMLSELEGRTLKFPSLMDEFIESRIGYVKDLVLKHNIQNFLGLGGELKTILKIINHHKKESENNFIPREKVENLYKKLFNMTTDQIINEYGLSKSNSQILLPSVLIFYHFLKMTKAEGIYAPMLSLRHGIVIDLIDRLKDDASNKGNSNDILQSVFNIAKDFHIDEKHSQQVYKLALSIFDQTLTIHKLGEEEKLYLSIAAILHDIGKHINHDQHDMHSYNIIRYQNIIGLSDRELNVIANIARYHSADCPDLSHDGYSYLTKGDRMMVSKLAAILKLAESLDFSNRQKVSKVEITRSRHELIFKIFSSVNHLLEDWVFEANTHLFSEVLGLKPVIKNKG